MNGARTAQVAILLLLFAVSAASAETAAPVEPDDPVPSAPGLTWVDLVREIVPDIEQEGRRFAGSTTIGLPHVEAGYVMLPPAEPSLDRGVRAVALGGTRHLLLIDLGESESDAAEYAVLALFDLSSSPHLRDALSVGLDRWNFFLEPAVRSLGAGRLITTASEHANSNQTYSASVLVLLRDGRFEPVDIISTFGDVSCSFERSQELAIATEPSETAFADIVATVTHQVIPTGADCGDGKPPETLSRTITVIYEWNEAQSKYAPDSDAFERLAAENEKRF